MPDFGTKPQASQPRACAQRVIRLLLASDQAEAHDEAQTPSG